MPLSRKAQPQPWLGVGRMTLKVLGESEIGVGRWRSRMNSENWNDDSLFDPNTPKTPERMQLLRVREDALRAELRMWEDDLQKHMDQCPECDDEGEVYCSVGLNIRLALQKVTFRLVQAAMPRRMEELPRGADKIIAREERNKQKFEQHNQRKIRRRKNK